MPAAPVTDGAAPEVTLPRPVARRLRAPSWRDGRLVIGVLLVLGSIVLGARLVAVAQQTTRAYVAARDLSPGEAVRPDDLRPVEVRLGALRGDYLTSPDVADGHGRVVQPVRSGQLVPTAALGTADQAGQREVSVTVSAGSADALVRGTAVEVWVSRHTTEGGTDVYDTPRRVVATATVARDPQEATGLMGGGSQVTLQLWVPAPVVPDLLSAEDAKDRVTAVPLPGATLRSTT